MNSEQQTGTVLEAIQLQKRYASGGQPIEVLQGVDLKISTSESVSIRGESGCGKSTLLNLLAGIETADGGTVLWNGSPLSKPGRAGLNHLRSRFLGFVFQAYYLIPELNALENVMLAGRIAGYPAARVRRKAMELLKRLGLQDRLMSHPAEMSGGERQRTAIARALLNEPQVVLADEPTGNLDERTADRVLEQLFSVVQEVGTGLLLVTHNPAYAAMTQRAFHLHEGRLHQA